MIKSDSYAPRIHYAARFFEGDGFLHPQFIYLCTTACGEVIPLAGPDFRSYQLTRVEENVTCEACLDAVEAGVDPFGKFLDQDDPAAKHLYGSEATGERGKTACGLAVAKGRKRKGDPPRVPSLTAMGGRATCRECQRYVDAEARRTLDGLFAEWNATAPEEGE